MNTLAITTAIRERLNGTLTTAPRAMTSDALRGDLFDLLNDEEVSRRAMLKPRYLAEVTDVEEWANGYEMGSTAIRRILVTVRSFYHLAPIHMLDEEGRESARGAASDDVELTRRALLTRQALAATSAAVATGLVSGCLAARSSARKVREEPATEGGLIEWEQRFEALVEESVPTT